MAVFDLTELQANYILDLPAAPADQVLAARAGEREVPAARRDRGAARDPRPGAAAPRRSSRPSWPTSPRPTGPRVVRSCWSRPGAPGHRCGAPRGLRRPVLGAALLDRAAGPHEQPGTAGHRRRPAVARRRHVGGGRAPPAVTSAWSPPAAGSCASRSSSCPPCRRRAGRRACRAARRSARSSTCRPARRCWPSPPCRPTPPGWRSAPPRASSSGSCPTIPATATSGRSSACATATRVVGAVELATGEEDLVFISSDGQLLHFSAAVGAAPGPAGGRHGRASSSPRASGWSRSPRSTRRWTASS